MAKSSTPTAAAQRAAIITGRAVPEGSTLTVKREFIRHEGRQGTRLIRISSIDQIIFNAGQPGGPWFMRIGSQEIGIDEALARSLTTQLTGWPSEEVFP